jgi:hypothetical protein
MAGNPRLFLVRRMTQGLKQRGWGGPLAILGWFRVSQQSGLAPSSTCGFSRICSIAARSQSPFWRLPFSPGRDYAAPGEDFVDHRRA